MPTPLVPKIVAGAVCTWGDKILLAKRAIEPRKGFWTVPAGYMELGETTEQAAERVLSAIDIAKPVQTQLQQDAGELDARWEQWYAAPIEREEVRALMNDTRTFLRGVPEATTATNAQLMEIMLAQDFQDLTGQVIKKITDVVYLIEQQLLGVLVENIALERREQFAANAAALAAGGLCAGPPGLRSHYGPAYYAAFVIDPDGHKLEAVHQ